MSGYEQMLERVRRTNPVPLPEIVSGSDLAELDSLLEQRRSLMTDLENATRTIDHSPPPRRRAMRPALAFVTTLVFVLVAVGAVAVLSTGDNPPESPPATTGAPPTTAAIDPTQPASTATTETTVTTTVPPASDPSFLDGPWRRVTVGEDMTVNDLVSTDRGLFAAAFGALLHSTDGATWSQVGLDRPHADMVIRVVEYAGGINAYGLTESSTVLWRSTDAATWTRSELLDRPLHPRGVTQSARGLVVYGDLDSPPGTPSGTHLLFSEDGVAHPFVGAADAGLVGVSLQSVIPTSEGLLALAMMEDGFSLYRADDGASWEPVPGSQLPLGAGPGSIMQHDGYTYVAGAVEGPITTDGGPRLAMWRATADGEWQPLQVPNLGGNSWISSMVATDYGLLAVGGHEAFDPYESSLVVLASSDGLVFEQVSDPQGAFRNGGTQAPPAVLGDQVVIFSGLDAWIWSAG